VKATAKVIGLRIKKLRTEKGFTQDELASKAGVDRSYMGRIERGEINISLEKAIQISVALGIGIEHIANDDDTKI